MAVVGGALAVAGALVMTLCVAGIARLAETNVKIHAAAMLAAIGVPLVLAYPLLAGDADIRLRALLVIAFSALTGPLATHALARTEAASRDDA